MIENSKQKCIRLFQVIYSLLAILYIIGMPFLTIYVSSTLEYIDLTKIMNVLVKFTYMISSVALIVFIIDIIINKEKRILIKKNRVIVLFLLFLVWCSVSTYFSSNTYISFFGILYRLGGLLQYFVFFIFGIIGFSLNKKNRLIYFRVFSIISFIIGLMTIYSDKLSWYSLPSMFGYSGIFFNINHYGYYLVISIIITVFLFLYDNNIKLKIIDFIIYFILAFCTIMNNTFGSYLAVLATLIVLLIYCIIKNKKLLLSVSIILFYFIFLSCIVKCDGKILAYENFKELFSDINIIKKAPSYKYPLDDYKNKITDVGNFRGALWVRGIKYAFEKPMFGYGLDNLGPRYLEDGVTIDTPHNLIINLAATVGIPGMLLYVVGYLYVLFWGLKKADEKDKSSLICYFVLLGNFISSMFGITAFYVAPYLTIILGMAIKDIKD